MSLIRTLTVSTTAFERTKEKFYGFRQTELCGGELTAFVNPMTNESESMSFESNTFYFVTPLYSSYQVHIWYGGSMGR